MAGKHKRKRGEQEPRSPKRLKTQANRVNELHKSKTLVSDMASDSDMNASEATTIPPNPDNGDMRKSAVSTPTDDSFTSSTGKATTDEPALVQGDEPGATSFTISGSPTLVAVQRTVREYLDEHHHLHQLVASSTIFHNNRVLLVQRSSQEKSYKSYWEIPGGSCEFTDASILHAAAREVFEETGLHVSHFRCQLGEGLHFETGPTVKRKQWMKFTFDVEVEEAEVPVNAHAHIDNKIKLNPEEHQKWVWAMEEEVKQDKAGKFRLIWIAPAQKDIILEGFARRKSRD